MNKKSLSEVYSILNIMDKTITDKIPKGFIDFIKINRDVFYNPIFEKLPDNFDNLEHDTKLMFALIYRKYLKNYDIKYNIENIEFEDEHIEKSTNNEEFAKGVNIDGKELVVYKGTLIEKIFCKIRSWFVK